VWLTDPQFCRKGLAKIIHEKRQIEMIVPCITWLILLIQPISFSTETIENHDESFYVVKR